MLLLQMMQGSIILSVLRMVFVHLKEIKSSSPLDELYNQNTTKVAD